jgi:type II secretory ATPase GspE/PulE/Tfp pilus assembly ATPase PilB-like protein
MVTVNTTALPPTSQQLAMLLDAAIADGATDWHLEAAEHHWRLRLRCAGRLQEQPTCTAALGRALLACLKVLAGLDMTETRRPQEGRFSWPTKKHTVYCRITTCATFWGEKCAVRFLNTQGQYRSIEALGLSREQQQLIKAALLEPSGMIILCGPTGSGKSTTLSSLLQHIMHDRHCITVEDPVEMPLPGVSHLPIQKPLGIDVQKALTTCLRLDPDIIMIGEIRDNYTANAAFNMAQTGHLVLTTVHANSCLGALQRLQSLGVSLADLLSVCRQIIHQQLSHTQPPHSAPRRCFQVMNIPKNVDPKTPVNQLMDRGCSIYIHSISKPP